MCWRVAEVVEMRRQLELKRKVANSPTPLSTLPVRALETPTF